MRDPVSEILIGDVRSALDSLPAQSVHMGITSPPYWGLRNYSAGNLEIGSERTFAEHVSVIVDVMRRVRRVLRDDGVFWLNYGDRYAERGLMMMPFQIALALQADGWYVGCDVVWHKPNPMPESVTKRPTRAHEFVFLLAKSDRYYYDVEATKEPYAASTIKEAQSEYTGEETKDYATAKAQQPSASKRRILASVRKGGGRQKRDVWADESAVWTIPVQPYRGGHFATFPERLVEPPILAGSSGGGACGFCGAPFTRVVEREPIPDEIKARFEAARARTKADTGRTDGHTNYRPNFTRGSTTIGWQPGCDCAGMYQLSAEDIDEVKVPCTVLDPFAGSGRAGIVAKRLGRSFIGIELNVEYATQAIENIEGAL
jgi:DNA modification methylase